MKRRVPPMAWFRWVVMWSRRIRNYLTNPPNMAYSNATLYSVVAKTSIEDFSCDWYDRRKMRGCKAIDQTW
jgi:hypothetical protein